MIEITFAEFEENFDEIMKNVITLKMEYKIIDRDVVIIPLTNDEFHDTM